jgi:hypothetical protein
MQNRLIKEVSNTADGCGHLGRPQPRKMNSVFHAVWVATGVCILAMALQSAKHLGSRLKWGPASLGMGPSRPLPFCSQVGVLNYAICQCHHPYLSSRPGCPAVAHIQLRHVLQQKVLQKLMLPALHLLLRGTSLDRTVGMLCCTKPH